MEQWHHQSSMLDPEIVDANCPRADVTWYQATAFCRWLSFRLGHEISLPTVLQWERAARGRHGWHYPSSPVDFPAGHMNCHDPDLEDSWCSGASAVGIFPHGATPEGGVHDMAGNVTEWCLDAVAVPEGFDDGDDEWAHSDWRALRGGCWHLGPEHQDCRIQFRQTAEVWDSDLGFRVCRRNIT
jgi:formylglycine-generating enzyme required for sulfatase activity